MKRIFTFITIAATSGIMITACNTDTKTPAAPTQDSTVLVNKEDTVGLAALKAAKAEEAARQAAIASAPQKDTVVIIKEVPKTTTKTRTVYKKTPVQNGNYTSNGDYTAKAPTTTTAEKKGWSKAAKGTAIGAGTGAVIGAIAGKGKGAIIGGVVGGAAGYGIGRHKDKKDGRVQ